MMTKRFAAFIMTYERPTEVKAMIKALFAQTIPPEKILVVDNSTSFTTKSLVENYPDERVMYFRVGYNSGPAGAALQGLMKLAEAGFQWVYWGDDNDPPRTPDAFACLFSIVEKRGKEKLGIVGLMGNHFDLHTAKIKMLAPHEMQGIQSVNSLAGGSSMLINTDVVKSGIVPDETLFFGYEELDFCLRVIKEGYLILIDADYYRSAKENSIKVKPSRFNRLGFMARSASLWREYYSVRNLLIIVWHKHRSMRGGLTLVARTLGKIILSFSRGIRFGFTYSKVVLSAMIDSLRERKGRTIEPGTL